MNNFDINLIKDTVTNFRLMSSHVLYALTLCVTIIVVAVPEGLPMMITLVLSSNMKRMVKDNVLVRKMMGIDSEGMLISAVNNLKDSDAEELHLLMVDDHIPAGAKLY